MKIKHIVKNYGTRNILNDINISFDKPQITFILGKSGEGKSTLLNLLGGLDNVTSWKILFKDYDLSKNSELNTFRSQEIGFVFQENNLMPSYNVYDNIKVALKIQNNLNDKDIDFRVRQILKKLDIYNLKDKKIHTLSGGEKQRVAIARALAKDSKIILADEPTGNLDEENSYALMKILKDLSKDKVVIIVSHNKLLAENFADNIYEIKDTKLLEIKKTNYNYENKILNKQQTKPKISFIEAIKYSIKNFKIKWSKFLFSIILLTIALSSSCLTYSIYTLSKGSVDETNIEILESDYLKLSSNSIDYIGSRKVPLNISNRQALGYLDNNAYKYKDIVKYSNIELKAIVKDEKGESEIININYIPINLNNFWKKRTSNGLKGKFINNDNEIILAKDIADKYYKNENCIGKNIVLNSKSNLYTFKIVGVNENENKVSWNSYISASKLNIIYENDNKSKQDYSLAKNIKGDIPPYMYITGINEISDNIIYGRNIENDNEIVISTMYLLLYLDTIGEHDFFIDNNLQLETLNMQNYEEIYSNLGDKYIQLFQNIELQSGIAKKKFKVVGITDGCDYGSYSYVSDNIAKDYINNYSPSYINLYLKDNSFNNIDKQIKILSEKKLNVESPLLAYQKQIKENTDNLLKVLLIAIIVILFITLFSIIAFSKLNIAEKKYEFGLFRSLGARKIDIFKISLIDNFIISFLSSIISIIVYYIAVKILNSYAINLGLRLISYKLTLLPFVFIVSLIISVISIIPDSIKISNISPSLILKKGE